MVYEHYRKRIEKLGSPEYIKENVYVDENITDFVGTLKEINAEIVRLKEEAKRINTEINKEWSDKRNVIMKEYHDDLSSNYSYVPREVFDKVYSVAYDKGHYAGYSEVENILEGLVDVFMETYNIGVEHGKNMAKGV